MPPKIKGGAKASASDIKGRAAESFLPNSGQIISLTKLPGESEAASQTVAERCKQRYYQTNPLEKKREEVGLSGLTSAEKKTYAYAKSILPAAKEKLVLSTKAEREFWKTVTKEALPVRRLRKDYGWGKDKSGRDVGTYQLAEFQQRSLKQARLSVLSLLGRQFVTKRQLAHADGSDVLAAEVDEERQRRKTMAALRRELYGEIIGPLAQDPEWDDVIPIPLNEPEGALAQIAYPEDYAEGR